LANGMTKVIKFICHPMVAFIIGYAMGILISKG